MKEKGPETPFFPSMRNEEEPQEKSAAVKDLGDFEGDEPLVFEKLNKLADQESGPREDCAECDTCGGGGCFRHQKKG